MIEDIKRILSPLPDRGWGVLRVPLGLVTVLQSMGLIKVQVTPTKDVFQARLTGAGRKLMREGTL